MSACIRVRYRKTRKIIDLRKYKEHAIKMYQPNGWVFGATWETYLGNYDRAAQGISMSLQIGDQKTLRALERKWSRWSKVTFVGRLSQRLRNLQLGRRGYKGHFESLGWGYLFKYQFLPVKQSTNSVDLGDLGSISVPSGTCPWTSALTWRRRLPVPLVAVMVVAIHTGRWYTGLLDLAISTTSRIVIPRNEWLEL